MNVLFVGDIVGKPGRRVLFRLLDSISKKHDIDLVIANVENAAGGFGVTRDIVSEILDAGVDVLTSGNHIWDKKDALSFIDEVPRLLRPENYPAGTPGKGWVVVESNKGIKVAVLNVMGTVFMHPTLDCPFECIDRVLGHLPEEVDLTLVDFHAEATSEKMAMGWHLDGKVSALVGSHTHVQTADERILPRHTAYISDLGMTGCYDSVIGMDKEKSLARFTKKIPVRAEVANGPATLCGAVVSIDEVNASATSIVRLRLEEPL